MLSGSTRSCRPTLEVPGREPRPRGRESRRGRGAQSGRSRTGAFCVTCCAWTPRKAQTAPPNATKTLVVAIQRGREARSLRPAEEDHDRRAERREQAEPGAGCHAPSPAKPAPPLLASSVEPTPAHPRSSESCRRRASFRRLIATTRPSPTQTSDAATAITVRPKIWPAPFAKWREKRDEREVPAVQHQLEREQDDERVAPDEHAERADPEQERREREVPVVPVPLTGPRSSTVEPRSAPCSSSASRGSRRRSPR